MDIPPEHEVDRRLCEYLDGQLSAHERVQLERRLEHDEALRRELARYGDLDELLAGLARDPVEGVDYDVQRAEIVAAVERQALLGARRLVLRPVFLGTMAAAALVLIAVTAAIVLLRPRGPLEPARPGVPMASAVRVELLPAAASPAGTAEVFVRLSAMEPSDWPLAPADEARSATPPAETVVISVGSERTAGLDWPADPIGVY